MPLMFEGFLLRALLGGVGVALVAGPLGCFIVWRRMAYFGDTMAHSALLGVALGLLLGIAPLAGVAGVTVATSLLLVVMSRMRRLSADTLLGILAHSGLAIGLVVLGLMPWVRVDLLGYLFGDVLAIAPADLIWIYAGGALVLAVLTVIWRPLLAATADEDLARAEGVPVARAQVAFMVLVALVIAMAMKIVGVLLITALLIIPAAAARRFSRSPEAMAVTASLFGVLAVILGLQLSLRLDTPSGPSIVAAALGLFVVSLVPLPASRSA